MLFRSGIKRNRRENRSSNNLKGNAKSIFFENDEILRTIHLPINYKDMDLLRLETEGYTWQEVMFNNLGAQVISAEDNLKRNILLLYRKLSQYGVTREEIEGLVNSKIYFK